MAPHTGAGRSPSWRAPSRAVPSHPPMVTATGVNQVSQSGGPALLLTATPERIPVSTGLLAARTLGDVEGSTLPGITKTPAAAPIIQICARCRPCRHASPAMQIGGYRGERQSRIVAGWFAGHRIRAAARERDVKR